MDSTPSGQCFCPLSSNVATSSASAGNCDSGFLCCQNRNPVLLFAFKKSICFRHWTAHPSSPLLPSCHPSFPLFTPYYLAAKPPHLHRPPNAILCTYSSEFPHLVRLITACLAVEACWKNIRKGKPQIIVPFWRGQSYWRPYQPKL